MWQKRHGGRRGWASPLQARLDFVGLATPPGFVPPSYVKNYFSFADFAFSLPLISMNVEIFFKNGIFLSLFLSMISFWTQNITGKSFTKSKEKGAGAFNNLGTESSVFIPLSKTTWKTSFSQFSLFFEQEIIVEQNFSEKLFVLSFFFITLELLSRWFLSGHPPLSNLYESLLFLIWGLLGFFLFVYPNDKNLDLKIQTKIDVSQSSPGGGDFVGGFAPPPPSGAEPPSPLSSKDPEQISNSFSTRNFVGCILSSTALFIQTFADWRLPDEMKEIKPLIPALQSNWLLMHVSIMILSYAALLIGCIVAITYIVIDYGSSIQQEADRVKTEKHGDFVGGFAPPPPKLSYPSTSLETTVRNNIIVKNSSQSQNEKLEILEASFASGGTEQSPGGAKPRTSSISPPATQIFLDGLDSLSYRILAFGFPLLTLGILSGAVWANEAWGSYWSWDPKETWAFITWLIFAFYLHTRLQYGWEGKKSAYVATFGFFIVWICYLGVNLLGKGLHSYGWLSS